MNNDKTQTLLDELSWRGFVSQSTFKDVSEVNTPRTLYWGVDPSADSMTIGNLAPAMMVRHFVNHGYKIILLAGGATGMIGDPDGKKQERDLKTIEEITHNKNAIAEQYKTIFNGLEFEIVDNYDWFKDMNYLDFLRNVGKYTSMTQLLDREFIQSRIGEGGDGISYAEFSYSLIQGFDYLHLYREKGASLQVGGSDQWGNMIAGVQFIRRLENAEVHVWATPLIVNKQTGVKFGKSEGGAIWLDPNKTSPYKFYQFWLNSDDETAEQLIKIYTMLSEPEVISAIENHRTNPAARSLQRILAREVTELIHGRERRESVERVTNVLFGSAPFSSLKNADLDELSHEIPVAKIGESIIDTLISAQLAASKGDGRRLIEGGAVSINAEKVHVDQKIISPSLLKKGKNNFVLVR